MLIFLARGARAGALSLAHENITRLIAPASLLFTGATGFFSSCHQAELRQEGTEKTANEECRRHRDCYPLARVRYHPLVTLLEVKPQTKCFGCTEGQHKRGQGTKKRQQNAQNLNVKKKTEKLTLRSLRALVGHSAQQHAQACCCAIQSSQADSIRKRYGGLDSHWLVSCPASTTFMSLLVVRITRPPSLAVWHRGRSHRRPIRSGSPNRKHFASLGLKSELAGSGPIPKNQI